jgi:voltage-gated sodium channel
MREVVKKWIERPIFQNFVMAVIIFNAIILGVETVQSLPENVLGFLYVLDTICLTIFVVELILKMYAYGFGFFKRPWCIFDFIIVGVTLIPASGNLSVLRSLRVLRVLRLISSVPQLRMVINSFLDALPGIGSVALLFSIIFYVFTVMSTKLFSAELPEYFGSLSTSMFTLFQLMTLEGWTVVVIDAMEIHSWAGLYFIFYILLSTFVLLNMVIAVVVSVMEDQGENPHMEKLDEINKRLQKIEKNLKK